MSGSIGIMSGAYFVSRTGLLSWLNNLLEINYQKVEQVSNGAAFCQIVDAMYPGKAVPLGEVKYNARSHVEILSNYKILQSAFSKCGIAKSVDIEKLSQGHFQDNFEFLQWFKSYYDKTVTTDVHYNARERRRRSGCQEPIGQGPAKPGRKLATSTTQPRVEKRSSTSSLGSSGRLSTLLSSTSAQAPARKVTRTTQPLSQTQTLHQHQQPQRQRQTMQTQNKVYRQPATSSLAQEVPYNPTQTIETLAELRYESKELTSERNFYYKKLLMIEEVCKKIIASDDVNPDPTVLTESVLKIIDGEEDCFLP